MKMKRFVTLVTILQLVLLIFIPPLAKSQPGCPSINAGSDQTVNCSSPCANLTANVLATGTTTNYTVTSIPYAPPGVYGAGTPVNVHADDQWSPVVTLPFPFCFYGNQYNQVVIGSNAITSFDLSNAGATCPWDQKTQGAIPTSNYPLNSIMWPYEDVDNSSAGDFSYELTGTAPCRMLIVSCKNIPYYGGVNSINTGYCTSPAIYATSEMVLYESTNVIEIYNQNKYVCSLWNDGYAKEGIQDATGANAAFVPGRNNGTQWTATNDAWRFTPNGTPNYSVSWWDGGTQIASGATTTVCPASTTTYTAQVVYNLCPGGQLTLTDDVIVNATITAPAPTITGPSSICSGVTGTLDAGAGYSSYLWSNSSSTQTIPVTTAGTYTVTVSNASGCTGTASAVVSLNANLTPAISGPSSICSGITATLDAGAGYSSYSWSNSSSAQTIPVTTAGTYTVTVSNVSGCTGTASAVISLNANLTPAISGPSSICSGNTATLDAGSGYSTYSWSTSAATQTIPVTTAGTYTVSVSNASGCTGTASAVIIVNPILTPTITGPSSICSGVTGTLDAGAGYSSYSWSNSAITQTIPVSAGTYTVTVSNASGCTGTASAVVNLNANLTPTISGPASICSGNTATLDAGSGYSTYSWSTSAATQAIPVTTAGSYTVTVSNASGCTGTALAVVNLNASPTPTITGPSSICSGSTATLDAGNGYSTYSWSTSAVTQTIPVTTAGSYTVTVSNALGCTGTNSIIISISAVPIANAGPDINICQGASASLNAIGGSNYSWSPASTLNNSFISNPIASPTSTTTYVVTVLNAFGCSATDDVIVGIYPPTIPVITSSGQTGFCDSSSVSVTLNAGNGYSSYSWSTSATTQTIFVNQVGTYTVTVIDSHGCSGPSAGINVYVEPPLPKPIILAATSPVFCQGDSVMLYVNNPYYTYLWSSGSTPAPHVWAYENETFVVTVTDSLGCISVSDPFQVQVDPLPVANASYSHVLLNASFYDFSLNATSWNWSFGDGQSSTLSNPTHTYAIAGTYTVILTAINNCGSDYDTLVINVPGPEGIVEYGNDFRNLIVFPIPVSDNVYIEFNANKANADIKLLDLLGNLIYEESLTDLNGKYIKSINMSGQASGMYFLELKSDNSFIVKKFNKQ
jgi:hypothetical protein